MHAQMYNVILTWIFVLPWQRFTPRGSTISAVCFAEGSTQLVMTQQWPNLTSIRAVLMRTTLIISRRRWLSSPTIVSIVSAALLLLPKVACDSQRFCLWVGLQPPATASPSHAATETATATTSPTSPALRRREYSMEVRWYRVCCRLERKNGVSDQVSDFLCVLLLSRFR